ncbi:1228_t:CDS:1, partial [Entrophospora sp. SA101]
MKFYALGMANTFYPGLYEAKQLQTTLKEANSKEKSITKGFDRIIILQALTLRQTHLPNFTNHKL